jgi:UDP-GlcNAc:undecaprenyl-phosphate/decaprenyl-phosphate GlcNAc-1-phosphate transferase
VTRRRTFSVASDSSAGARRQKLAAPLYEFFAFRPDWAIRAHGRKTPPHSATWRNVHLLTYMTVFVISLSLSFLFTPLVRNAARRIGLVDKPSEQRQVHTIPTPRVGGVAIVAAFFLSLISAYYLNDLVTQSLREGWSQLARLVAPCLAIFVLGLIDDVFRLSARVKFLAQALIAVWFHFFSQGITSLPNPVTGETLQLGLWGLPITVLWLVGISNAFNLIDGIDGLSAGSALFSTLAMLYVALANQNLTLAILACALAGAILGFLKYNFNPATVFMGDCGSLFIGFTLAALSIQGSQKSVTVVTVAIPLLSFGLPVMETALSIGRRYLSGKPVFGADRRHIHHQLLARGFSQRKTVILLYGVSAFFALASLLAYDSPGRLLGVILLTLGLAMWIAIQHLGYHEFGEVGRLVQRSLNQRSIIANNIHLQNLARSLTASPNVETLFTALGEYFEATDFTHVRLHLPLRYAWKLDTHAYFEFSKHGPHVIAHWVSPRHVGELQETANFSLPLRFGEGSELEYGRMDLHRAPDSAMLFDVNLLFGGLRIAAENAISRLAQEPHAAREAISVASGSTRRLTSEVQEVAAVNYDS